MSFRSNARRPAAARRPASALPELPSGPVDRPQLRSQAVRLLEVIAQDLLVLLSAVGRDPLQPGCEALVKERPLVLGQALIRGVTYEQVAEAEGVLARHVTLVRPYQLLAHESEQMRRHVRPRVLGCQLGNRSSMEHLALDRSPLHDLPLPGLESVEARGEQGLDGRRHLRHLETTSVLRDHGQHLLDEEGVALGRLDDLPAGPLAHGQLPHEVGHELFAL